MCLIWGIETGVARGSGRQDIGAYVNLAAYYLCGIPTAIILGFRFKMGGRGLWIGITVGSCVQAALLGLIVNLTNWKQQVSNSESDGPFDMLISSLVFD